MSTPNDPLATAGIVDRVNYATGLMLDAADFEEEQLYHRSRLARALTYLHGGGTVAGLRVSVDAERAAPGSAAETTQQVMVAAGLAIDRLGRLIEVRKPLCIKLADWYAMQPADQLHAAVRAVDLEVETDQATPPTMGSVNVAGVVADLFVSFVNCERGLTPAFRNGPFDATDAVVPSRVRDACRVTLVARRDGGPTPGDPYAAVAGIANAVERRQAYRWHTLDTWRGDGERDANGSLRPLPEHIAGQDPTALFLARIVIPATRVAGARPNRRDEAVRVDNYARRFVPSAVALASWIGA